MSTISYSDFEKVDIRIGTIIEVNDFPQARKPAYQLLIDFGQEIGIKRSSAKSPIITPKNHCLENKSWPSLISQKNKLALFYLKYSR